MRNFSEDEKLNPSLIEGTPPFLKTSQNIGNVKVCYELFNILFMVVFSCLS